MIVRSSIAAMIFCPMILAAERSGQATVEWISASPVYEADKPLPTAFRMKVDDGWHTYWSNPGEGGMKWSVKWELPDGWVAGEPEHPVPIRFTTGGLAGFGYEGTVVFPVLLTPPREAKGEVKLAANVSWLTCNDSTCVPGSAKLHLSLNSGELTASADAAAIEAAQRLIPRPLESAVLEVSETGGETELRLTGKLPVDPTKAAVFPQTPQALDPAAPIEFSKEGDGWTAKVPKNEYANGPLKSLTLVFASSDATEPFSLSWNGK